MGVSTEPCRKPSTLPGLSSRRSSQRQGPVDQADEGPNSASTHRQTSKEAPLWKQEFDEKASHKEKASVKEAQARIAVMQAEMDANGDAAAKSSLERQKQGADQSPDVFVDVAQDSDQKRTDPEKEAIQKEIQNKHLSIASSADAYKRESIETAPRSSTVLSDSASDTFTIPASIAFPACEPGDSRPPAERSRVALQVPEAGNPPRPTHSRGGTVMSGITVASSRRSLPSLRRRETKLAQKEAHPWQHLGITLGLPMVVLFDLVVPCIVYYVWYDHRVAERDDACRRNYAELSGVDCPVPIQQYDREILGWAIASFGLGEVWILAARVWRLFFRREDCAPLLSRSRWELDATSWVYLVAVLLALIPFIVGAELEIPRLYLYSPCFIFVFLGILMVITSFVPITLPVGINSQGRGSRIRPLIYYAAEDFIAVDGLQDREFRVRYNERYEANQMFRKFFFHLTLFWCLGVAVYIACASAIIWKAEFHHAFGLIFGVLFAWIFTWAGVTYVWVQYEMRRENQAFEEEEEGEAATGDRDAVSVDCRVSTLRTDSSCLSTSAAWRGG